MPSLRASTLLAGAVAALVACGGGGNSNPPSGLTFSSTDPAGLQVLPQAVQVLSAGGPAFDVGDMTRFQLDLVDPIKLLVSGEQAARLGNSPVKPSVAAGVKNKASFQFTGIDKNAINPIAPGLVVNVLSVAGVQTTPTATGVVTKATIDAAQANGTVAATVPAFVIPDPFAAILAQLAGKGDAATLGAGGYILVLAVDRATGSALAGVSLAPVAGHQIVYPHFSSGTPSADTTATDSSGLAVITGPATGTSPIQLIASSSTTNGATANLPTCASDTATSCLAPAAAGLTAGFAFVAPIAKQ